MNRSLNLLKLKEEREERKECEANNYNPQMEENFLWKRNFYVKKFARVIFTH